MKVCKSGFDHFSALSGTLSPNFIKSPFLWANFPLFFKNSSRWMGAIMYSVILR